jgi:hypothetical protein
MAGDPPTARSTARKLLAAHPDFTIRRFRAVPAFRDMPEYLARMAQGLRDAGLPEGRTREASLVPLSNRTGLLLCKPLTSIAQEPAPPEGTRAPLGQLFKLRNRWLPLHR